MWLVNAALRHPYTVWVGMLLVTVLGLVAYRRTPTDILPNLNVPVVVVFCSYRGMPAPDMEQSVVVRLERALTRCDHLEHIESRSLLGIGIIKVYFRAEVDPDVAASQVLSLVNSEMQYLPPGMVLPTIMKYDASSIPVGNLVISSQTRDDKFLLDLADHQLRDDLAGVEGLASAPVFGGVFRQVQIYVDPRTLQALNLSPAELAQKVNAQSQILPTGEIRIGPQTYYVSSNAMVGTPDDFARIPIGAKDGRKIVYLGDVATILDSTRWRTNTVRADGQRAVYLPLLRQAGASAVKVVDEVQAFIPKLYERGVIPPDVKVEVAFDQAQYVRDALENLRTEAVGGAVLAALVVLLFLGSLRCAWIVALAVPLSILAAFLGLYFLGHTLNIMTLGGLALILGRILDDSIVDVENTVRHLNLGSPPLDAARESAREIATPVLMATITTTVVFFPVTFMAGVGKYLFTPLAVSATLAMFASYLVSRTVSPLFCSRFLRAHQEPERLPRGVLALGLLAAAAGLGWWLASRALPDHVLASKAWVWSFYGVLAVGLAGATVVALGLLLAVAPAFDRLYEQFAAGYEVALRACLRERRAMLGGLVLLALVAGLAFPRIGQELFPEVDASEFTVHMRVSGGARVEETERQVARIEHLVRDTVPAEDLDLILANLGVSSRWSAIYTPNNGPHAAFVRVQLRSGFDGRTMPTAAYVARLRERLAEAFPGNDFFFETGGMIRHILNAGAVAPIEVQVYGRDNVVRRTVARQLDWQASHLAQVSETYMPQAMDLPQLRVEVDRARAALLGYTETDVIRNVVTALMSSAQIAPNFWIDPKTGNPYFIGVQYPEYLVENVQTLENIPISPERTRPGGPVRLLSDVAAIERTQGPVEVYHENATRVSQLFINVAGNDLAGVAAAVERMVNQPALDYALGNLPADHEDLAENDAFRQKLAVYLQKKQRSVRHEISKEYGLDPDRLKLPPGVRVEVRGEVKSMRDSFAEMAFSLTLAVLLVYLVMAAQFASWVDPLVMIVAAPLGLIGVVFALWATDTSLNIQSCMGVLMMVGISVSNSVLLVEFANRQRAEGLATLDAVVRAARIRLRPILMTTLATIVGLLPLAIHLRPGDEMNLPLARAVIGGLIGSTVLMLFAVPVLYVLLKPKGPALVGVPASAGGELKTG
jgi:hydrophobic/amphiphilic exporter-1 (mainly G- bacteria), HAE1 family